MKRLLTLMAVVFSLGLTTVAMDAEAAKRMGSGKSMGTQRQATPDKAPAAATPAAARMKSRRSTYSLRSVTSEYGMSAGFLISICSRPVGRRDSGPSYSGDHYR